MLARLEVLEQEELSDWRTRTRFAKGATEVVMVAGSTLAFSIVALSLFAVSRDFAGARRAQHALREAHDELEWRVVAHTAELVQSNQIIHDMSEACVALDEDWHFTFVNAHAEEILGRTDLLGRSLWTARPEWSGTVAEEHFRRSMVERSRVAFETKIGDRWFDIRLSPTGDGLAAFLLDISERKRAELALRRNEALLRETGAIAKVGGWEFDPGTGQGNWTEEVARIHGLAPVATASLEVGLSYYRGDARARIEAALKEAVDRGKPYDLELELTLPDGTTKWIRTIAHPLMENGKVVSVHGSFQDISDRKKAERVLQEAEERLQTVLENIDEVFWMADANLETIFYVSPAYEKIWGRTCASLLANPLDWLAAVHVDDRAQVSEAAATKFARGDYDEIYRIVRPSGDIRWIRDRAYPVRDAAGKISQVVGTSKDITDERHAEIRISVQNAVTATLSEGRPLIETARQILDVVCRQLEFSIGDLWTIDAATQTLRCVELWHPLSTEFRSFAEATKSAKYSVGEGLPGRVWATNQLVRLSDVTTESNSSRCVQAAELGLRGGFGFPIKLRGEVFGVLEFFSEQSFPPDRELQALFTAIGTQIGQFIERKRLEEQFHQAQKMEALGTLAGGIAHDFNNILAAISGYAELARGESSGHAEALEYIDAIAKGSSRATNLVRQILGFSRVQEHSRHPLELRPIVEEAIKLLRATVPATIEFDLNLMDAGALILGDPSQMHQVVMNLATNAVQAMKGQPGRLSIALEHLTVEPLLASSHPGLHTGAYVRLTVADTGHGMDEAILRRIYDPFFTTKAPGEGTGLGLAVVHGMVQSHDGVITVESQRGKGTRFQLYFPCAKADRLEIAPASEGTVRGKGERLLLVDDELPLATMGKMALEKLGYTVEAQTVPTEALALFAAQPNRFAAVITDLTMPGMIGTDLAVQMLKIRPGLPVILTTGYSAMLKKEDVRALGIREMALKPLTIETLSQIIRRSLDRNGGSLD